MSMAKTFISFAAYCPQLIKEWHSSKNKELKPENVSYGSARKVWWQCDKGHEWEASINHRSNGRGCPYCAQIQRAKTKRINIVAKRGSLADNNKELAMQWHPTKNGLLTPYDITANTDEKVWWQCKKGHEWQATVNSRNSGVGCPVCSGHKIVVGINDLATINPKLASEWHPTKNYNLKPTDVTANTDKRVWWQCKKGHEWKSAVSNRTNGCNCPICSNKKVLIGYNDLATLNPILAKEWHPIKNGNLTPQSVTLGSNKKVWWKCEKGHEWVTIVSHRSKGTRCPKCFGETKTSFPEQAVFYYLKKVTKAINRYKVDFRTEIDVFLPEYKIGIEYDGIYFHKGEKAELREKAKDEKLKNLGIYLIRIKEKECDNSDNCLYSKPGASNFELTKTINSLIELINKKANTSFNFDINVDRDYFNIYEQYILSEKENSISNINPKLASEWHPTKNGELSPEHFSIGANRKVWWMCSQGHEWQAMINSRAQGVGCPVCSGHKIVVGINDLETLNKKLAKEWHSTKNNNLTPQDVTANTNRKVWWKCEKGHEWKAWISDRTNGRNCPICAGKKVLTGYNDLATTNPKLASEWNFDKNKELTPNEVTEGSDKKVWWQCKKGHEWQATISSRNHGHGCPYCAGQKVIGGVNDLLTFNQQLAKEWHPIKNGDLTPQDIMAGSNRKVWWQCKKGHEWEAVIGSRSAGRTCPICSNQKVLLGYNDLATTNSKLASEWHPTKNGDLTPHDVTAGSNRKVWWQCKKGHEWQNTVNLRNSGHNCPYCLNQMLLVGYNDLATTNPKLASEWHPIKNGNKTPKDVMAGSNKKAWWRCDKGHEWEAVISSRNKGAGCKWCYWIKRQK